MTSHFGEFIFDSSVVLALVFEESRFKSRVAKITRDVKYFKVDYLITQSTMKECRQEVNNLGRYLAETIRDLSHSISNKKSQFEPNTLRYLDRTDNRLFQEYFSTASTNLKFIESMQAPKESTEYLETWIISTLEDELREKKTVNLEEFFTRAGVQATKLYSDLKLKLNEKAPSFKQVDVGESESNHIRNILSFCKDPGDIPVLAEAIEYRKTHGKIVFVSLDYAHIVSSAKQIESATGLVVRDPLYALNSLMDLNS